MLSSVQVLLSTGVVVEGLIEGLLKSYQAKETVQSSLAAAITTLISIKMQERGWEALVC